MALRIVPQFLAASTTSENCIDLVVRHQSLSICLPLPRAAKGTSPVHLPDLGRQCAKDEHRLAHDSCPIHSFLQHSSFWSAAGLAGAVGSSCTYLPSAINTTLLLELLPMCTAHAPPRVAPRPVVASDTPPSRRDPARTGYRSSCRSRSSSCGRCMARGHFHCVKEAAQGSLQELGQPETSRREDGGRGGSALEITSIAPRPATHLRLNLDGATAVSQRKRGM